MCYVITNSISYELLYVLIGSPEEVATGLLYFRVLATKRHY